MIRTTEFTADPSKLPGGAKGIPNPPAVVMAENKVDLQILPAGLPDSKPDLVLNGDDWTRWNDFLEFGLFCGVILPGLRGLSKKSRKSIPKKSR